MSTPTPPDHIDVLETRTGLPSAFRYLEALHPRSGWSTAALHPMAQHWLDIHGWFRQQMTALAGIGIDWREGRLGARDYRGMAAPRLRQLLSNLHHHHTLESTHAFPPMIAAEPRMADGFALLDRDHEAIEQLMAAMAEAGNDLIRAGDGPADLTLLAEALVDRTERATSLIGRHLWDEEEIVVPVLNLRGDQITL